MKEAFSKWMGTSRSQIQSKHTPTLDVLKLMQHVST